MVGKRPVGRWAHNVREGLRRNRQLQSAVMDLFPLPDDCNIFYLSHVKDVLRTELGLDEGFRTYCEQLSPQKSINRSRPQRIQPGPVARLRDVASGSGISFAEIHPAGEPFLIPPTTQIGESKGRDIIGATRSSYVGCLSNARIHGRSAFLEVDGSMVLDYEQRELLLVADRWNVDPYVFSSEGDVAWKIEFDQPFVEIEEAVRSGVSTMAWGHWLPDYVPRYVSAVSSGHLPKVPVLIDSGMPPTHRELLEFVMPEGTEIIEGSPEPELRVGRLWCAASLTYSAMLPRMQENFPWDLFCSDPARHAAVFNEIGRSVDRLPQTELSADRLYLARKPFRWTKMFNHDTIESLVRSRDFTVVYPEDYPLREIAKCVRSARYIMGPLGSQMWNALFARPGARVCYLTHRFLFGAWPYVLRDMGVDVTMLDGPAVNLNDGPEAPTFGYPHHADYEIEPDRLAKFLDEWLV